MTTMQIYEELAKTNNEDQQRKLLEEQTEDHEVWFFLHYILCPLKPFPFNFKFLDPPTHGNGVKDGILKKIIEKVSYGELTHDGAADALSAFSHYCSKEQWNEWIKPFLERKLSAPVSVSLFNEYCPWQYRIKPPSISILKRLTHDSKISPLLVIEPLYEQRRVFIIVRNQQSFVMDSDGTPLSIELPPLFQKAKILQTVILEAYENKGYFIVRDILLEEQLYGAVPIASVPERLKIAEDILKSILGNSFDVTTPLELIECYTNDISSDSLALNQDLEVIFEAGHSGVVFRNSHIKYHDDNANIVVNPNRRSILTCVDVIPGEKETKYENKALYLVGKGTLNKKKFTTKVRFGLTLDQRELCLRDRDKIKGNKFSVLSCGLDRDSQHLLFPIFQAWR